MNKDNIVLHPLTGAPVLEGELRKELPIRKLTSDASKLPKRRPKKKNLRLTDKQLAVPVSQLRVSFSRSVTVFKAKMVILLLIRSRVAGWENEIEFKNIAELANLLGITKSGRSWTMIHESLEHLVETAMLYQTPTHKGYMSTVQSVHIHEETGAVKVTLNPEVIDLFEKVAVAYSVIDYAAILALPSRSIFTFRLYEHLVAFSYELKNLRQTHRRNFDKKWYRELGGTHTQPSKIRFQIQQAIDFINNAMPTGMYHVSFKQKTVYFKFTS